MPTPAALVRENYEFLSPKIGIAIGNYYKILFARHPHYKPLFANTTRGEQQKKFIATLHYIMMNLEFPDTLKSTLADLGARHETYGVMPEDYAPVGECLIEALASVAGDTWSPELEEAWRDALAQIAEMALAGTQSRSQNDAR